MHERMIIHFYYMIIIIKSFRSVFEILVKWLFPSISSQKKNVYCVSISIHDMPLDTMYLHLCMLYGFHKPQLTIYKFLSNKHISMFRNKNSKLYFMNRFSCNLQKKMFTGNLNDSFMYYECSYSWCCEEDLDQNVEPQF